MISLNSGGKDAFYTPAYVAEAMVDALPSRLEGGVVDYGAGEGALLSAAARRFGTSVELIAGDANLSAVAGLRRRFGLGVVGRIDLFNARSRGVSRVWKLGGEASAVLLNPPYSYRGGPGVSGSRVRDTRIPSHGRASPSASFLDRALSNIRRDGATVVVLMPSNSQQSELDFWMWETWAKQFRIELLGQYSRTSFKNATAKTSLYRFTAYAGGRQQPLSPPIIARQVRSIGISPMGSRRAVVEIIRGRTPVHRLGDVSDPDGAVFLHTTHLRSGNPLTQDGSLKKVKSSLAFRGHLVLVPRVGKFDPKKLVYLDGTKASYVLSDCLFALRAQSQTGAKEVRDVLRSHSDELSRCYSGSCAPYLTWRRLHAFIEALGYMPKFVSPSHSDS